jgi:hypothetical protein
MAALSLTHPEGVTDVLGLVVVPSPARRKENAPAQFRRWLEAEATVPKVGSIQFRLLRPINRLRTQDRTAAAARAEAAGWLALEWRVAEWAAAEKQVAQAVDDR